MSKQGRCEGCRHLEKDRVCRTLSKSLFYTKAWECLLDELALTFSLPPGFGCSLFHSNPSKVELIANAMHKEFQGQAYQIESWIEKLEGLVEDAYGKEK